MDISTEHQRIIHEKDKKKKINGGEFLKAEVYYWKDIQKLLDLSIVDERKYPDIKKLEEEYVKLPISFEIKEDELDEIYSKLNQDDNPMGTPEMQQWIRDNGLKHTSMSVGDIIKHEKGIFICEDVGWTKL